MKRLSITVAIEDEAAPPFSLTHVRLSVVRDRIVVYRRIGTFAWDDEGRQEMIQMVLNQLTREAVKTWT